MQLVVPSAVRNAVSAATRTFTVSSMILCFFIISSFLFFVTQILRPSDFLKVTQKFTGITEILLPSDFYCPQK